MWGYLKCIVSLVFFNDGEMEWGFHHMNFCLFCTNCLLEWGARWGRSGISWSLSKPENQNNNCLSFILILLYTISSIYCCSILGNGHTTKFQSYFLLCVRAGMKISFCLLSLYVSYLASLSPSSRTSVCPTHTSPTVISATVTHIVMLQKMKGVVDFYFFALCIKVIVLHFLSAHLQNFKGPPPSLLVCWTGLSKCKRRWILEQTGGSSKESNN